MVSYEIFFLVSFLQVIVWDCLNNYEYDNAIFLAERLHAEGNYLDSAHNKNPPINYFTITTLLL